MRIVAWSGIGKQHPYSVNVNRRPGSLPVTRCHKIVFSRPTGTHLAGQFPKRFQRNKRKLDQVPVRRRNTDQAPNVASGAWGLPGLG